MLGVFKDTMFRYSRQGQIHFIDGAINVRESHIIPCSQQYLSVSNIEEVIFSLEHAGKTLFKYSTMLAVRVCNNRWVFKIEHSKCKKVQGVQFGSKFMFENYSSELCKKEIENNQIQGNTSFEHFIV